MNAGVASHHPLLADIRHALPDLKLITTDNSTAEERVPYEQDWRKRYRGRALAIAFPSSTEQVQTLVKLCAQAQVSVVPQGGNTSLVGGSVPDDSGQQLVINLSRMQGVISVDRANLSMTVQAGCTLAQVQDAARQAGLLFPLSLASEGSCTIGGNLATNAGGTQVLRYGTARELCLGLEAVNAAGERYNGLTALRKDNTGYATRDLLIGSEGTLAIITAATLRLFPAPAVEQACLAHCPDLQAAVDLLALARQHLDSALTGFEAIHHRALELALRHTPLQAAVAQTLVPQGTTPQGWTVLIDTHSHTHGAELAQQLERLLALAHEQGLISNAILSQSDREYRAMWQLRETIPMAEKIEGLMVKHDIGVPSSLLPSFTHQCEQALQHAFPGCRVVCFGHLGDGNLHYNVQGPADQSDKDFIQAHEKAVNQIVYDTVQTLGGTISAEHGIGQLKRDELPQRIDPVRLSWMRHIKRALDPQNLMNPGRMLPTDSDES